MLLYFHYYLGGGKINKIYIYNSSSCFGHLSSSNETVLMFHPELKLTEWMDVGTHRWRWYTLETMDLVATSLTKTVPVQERNEESQSQRVQRAAAAAAFYLKNLLSRHPVLAR